MKRSPRAGSSANRLPQVDVFDLFVVRVQRAPRGSLLSLLSGIAIRPRADYLSALLLVSIAFSSSFQESTKDLAPSVCKSAPSFATSTPTLPNSFEHLFAVARRRAE